MSKEILSKTYVGDGVYAEFSPYDIKLYTQEGNEIFLEFPMLDTLKAEYDRLFDAPVHLLIEGKI